ncbi:DUF6286 domain-containing protein [uncultured Jatrophihabitans sp.]|uniref:DUF6286 domain-containing protein n=1 Tax=uncultured Jatrophihabitans sp. TaxID=1610747 RepID=UPI0035CAEC50
MRLLNRALAALLALALIVVGVLLIIEVIADRTVKHPAVTKWHRVYHWAQHTSWTQGSLRVGLIVVAAVGVILLLAEIKRTRVTRFRIASDDAHGPLDAAYTRRGVADAVRTAVLDVDGVRGAKVAVTRRKVTVRAATAARDSAAAAELEQPAQDAAQQQLDALELAHAPRLRLTATERKR